MSSSNMRINAVVRKTNTTEVVNELTKLGVSHIHIATGRTPVFDNPKGFMRIISGKDTLISHPVDFISFFCNESDETQAMDIIFAKGKLSIPGQGVVYSQQLEVNGKHPLCEWQSLAQTEKQDVNYFDNLIGINCVVQRGHGDEIARVILESGSGVPTMTYGIGTGVRDKLGLLRITIPAEKEVLTLVTTTWDAPMLLEKMISVGKLDQPGRGFINTFPIKKGIVNTKVSSSSTRYAADMEQIIATLDKIQGNMDWRKNQSEASIGGSKRAYFSGKDLHVICNDGCGVDLVKAAMEVGAAGATIEKLSLRSKKASDTKISKAREICTMMVPDAKLSVIVDAINNAGALDDKSQAIIFSGPAPQAFTYLKSS